MASAYSYQYRHPTPVFSGRRFGAFHTAAMPYVFGNLDRRARAYGPGDGAVSRQLQAYLLGFLRQGRPQVPDLPRWPRAIAGDGQVMFLGDKAGPGPAVSSPARFEALRAYAEAGGGMIIF